MKGLGTDHVISDTATEYRPANSPIMLFLAKICFLDQEKILQKSSNKGKRKNIYFSLYGNIMRTRFD